MTYEIADRAERFARSYHGDQFDKCGRPYVGHLERVAMSVAHLGPEYAAVGWLHDVVEDTAATIEDVGEGFNYVVAGAVDRLTRRPHPEETHAEYIERLCAPIGPGPRGRGLAVRVKIADTLDNMDPDRRDAEGNRPAEYDGMLSRYHGALKRLIRALDEPYI